MVCDYSFTLLVVFSFILGAFYILMPPKRVFTQLHVHPENTPSTITNKEINKYINKYVDLPAAAAISKALSAHVDLFSDYSGVFELVSIHHISPVYVYKFNTTVSFTDSHTKAKYHKLVPNPLYPEIYVPTVLEIPFRALDFAPVFASDERSYIALRNIGRRFEESEISHANIMPLGEDSRRSHFSDFVGNHYPQLDLNTEHVIKTGYTRYKGRIDLVLFCSNNPVPVILGEGEGEV